MQAIRPVTAGLNNAVGAFKHKKLSIMARGSERTGEQAREAASRRTRMHNAEAAKPATLPTSHCTDEHTLSLWLDRCGEGKIST